MATKKTKPKLRQGKPFHFIIDADLVEPLEQLTEATRRSLTDEINLAIRDRVKRKKELAA